MSGMSARLRTKEGWDPVRLQFVSGNYFDFLGVPPTLGRGFFAEEDGAPGAHPVAVISHRLWQQQFGGDPAIMGKTLTLKGEYPGDRTVEVVGVTPVDFDGLGRPDAILPVSMEGAFKPSSSYSVFGRLADNVPAADRPRQSGQPDSRPRIRTTPGADDPKSPGGQPLDSDATAPVRGLAALAGGSPRRPAHGGCAGPCGVSIHCRHLQSGCAGQFASRLSGGVGRFIGFARRGHRSESVPDAVGDTARSHLRPQGDRPRPECAGALVLAEGLGCGSSFRLPGVAGQRLSVSARPPGAGAKRHGVSHRSSHRRPGGNRGLPSGDLPAWRWKLPRAVCPLPGAERPGCLRGFASTIGVAPRGILGRNPRTIPLCRRPSGGGDDTPRWTSRRRAEVLDGSGRPCGLPHPGDSTGGRPGNFG